MKVKEKMSEGRGRPRKYKLGDGRGRALLAPQNLLLELRAAANVRRVSMNEEIISRLARSLDYTPLRPLIRTEEGERLVALSRLFSAFMLDQIAEIKKKYPVPDTDAEGHRQFIPEKNVTFTCTFPSALLENIDIRAKLNGRSANREMVERLLWSFNYIHEHQLPESDEVARLSDLVKLFNEFVSGKVRITENPLLRDDDKK